MSGGGKYWDFRDISLGLKIMRDFLLGRKHNLHCRFPPLIAPRTLPTPDVPRCPDYKYSAQYYCNRSVRDSIKPPVIAPIAEGPSWPIDPTKKAEPGGGMKPEKVSFRCAPTPGPPWWWDGHCYYECQPDPPLPPCPPCPPCPPPCPPCPDPDPPICKK